LLHPFFLYLDIYIKKYQLLSSGDRIIECYSREDPKLQSVWNTDVSRLTFIIKQCIGEENETKWIKDSCGTTLLQLIIVPLYNAISEMMKMYVEAINSIINTKDMKHTTTCNLVEKSKFALEIIQEVVKGKVHHKTIKYISPHLEFDKQRNKIVGLCSDIIDKPRVKKLEEYLLERYCNGDLE